MDSFAPVFIPTLNRYHHLKQCLESLSKCTWSERTEVFVALDYPPSEKYIEGWKKNKDFLEHCGNMGFKMLHVIERDENYGTWNVGDRGNLKALLEENLGPFDHYITSEDDNVFSPNFLEYMNKGFHQFEDDENVVALCGFRWYFPIQSEENTFFRLNTFCTPWGMGYWKKKNESHPSLDYQWFRSHLSLCNLIKVYKNCGPAFVNAFIEFSNSDPRHSVPVDQHESIYMALEDKYQICPIVSLVRNIGLDGTGVTMPQNTPQMEALFESTPVSDEPHFEFIGTGFECAEYNTTLFRKERNWNTSRFYLRKFLKKWIRLIKYW